MPERIQRRRIKNWRMPESAVYVGRPSRWGNPFVVGDGAVYRFDALSGCALDPDKAVRLYRVALLHGWYRRREDDGRFRLHRMAVSVEQVRRELRGRDLACWCPLRDSHGQPVPCHADVLLAVANS